MDNASETIDVQTQTIINNQDEQSVQQAFPLEHNEESKQQGMISSVKQGMCRVKMKRFLIQRRASLQIELDSLDGEELLQEVIHLVKKPWNNRTYRDNKVIMKCISRLHFFRDIFGKNYESMIVESAKYFKYSSSNEGEKVFEQGDYGDKFYVILRGKVRIEVEFKRQENQISSPATQIPSPEIVEKIHIRDLCEGDSFGELALIERKPRSATISCLTNCDFITFDKNSFDKILKNEQIQKFKDEILSLKKNYLFTHFSGNSLKTIFLLFQVAKYKKGDVIYSEGDQSDKIFLIKEGEFKISRTMNVKYDIDQACSMNVNSKKKQSVLIDLGILGVSQTFGEEEFFTKDCRQQTSVCYSKEGELMILNRREFFKKMGYDVKQIERMERDSFNKKQMRDNQFASAVQIFGLSHQDVIKDKGGNFVNHQLTQFEIDQMVQKELIAYQLSNQSFIKTPDPTQKSSVPRRARREQKIREAQLVGEDKDTSIIPQQLLLPIQAKPITADSITKYQFVRKKVISTSTTNELSQTYHGNLFQDFGPGEDIERTPVNIRKKDRFETIQSRNGQFHSFGKISIFKDSSKSKNLNIFIGKDYSRAAGEQNCANLSTFTINRAREKSWIGDSSPIQHAAHNSCLEMVQLLDNQQSPSYLESPKNMNNLLLQLEPDCIDTSRSFEKLKEQVCDASPIMNRRISTTSNCTKVTTSENDNLIKSLIQKEISHHSLFLQKRKIKQAENIFYQSLDETIHSKSQQTKVLETQPINLKELFSEANKKNQSRKKKSPAQSFSNNDQSMRLAYSFSSLLQPINPLNSSLQPQPRVQKDTLCNQIYQPLGSPIKGTHSLQSSTFVTQRNQMKGCMFFLKQKTEQSLQLNNDNKKQFYHIKHSKSDQNCLKTQISVTSLTRSSRFCTTPCSTNTIIPTFSNQISNKHLKYESQLINKYDQKLPLKYLSEQIKDISQQKGENNLLNLKLNSKTLELFSQISSKLVKPNNFVNQRVKTSQSKGQNPNLIVLGKNHS